MNKFLMGLTLSTATLVATSGALAASTTAPSNSTGAGAYIGGQLGYTKMNEGKGFRSSAKTIGSTVENGTKTGTKSIKDNGGLGGRVFAGYQFNRNFAVEGGFTKYASNKYNAASNVALPTQQTALNDVKVTSHSFDLDGKVILPLDTMSDSMKGFSVYGKAGASYMVSEAKGSTVSASSDQNAITSTTTSFKDKHSAIAPIAGAGVSYQLENGLAVDVDYTHVFGRNGISSTTANPTSFTNLKKFVPSSNDVMGGLSYHFAA